MELRDKSKDGDDSPPIFNATDAQPTGLIPNPSQLTSVSMLGMPAVFGFTTQKGTGATKNDVSLVSPVYEVMSSTELANKTIASCYTSDKAWIYYLSGADESKLKIIQARVGPSPELDTLEASNVRYGSSLAAYTADDTNYVIYQHKAGDADNRHFYEYEVDESTTKIDHTNDAAALTSMAAVYYNSKVYLYYMDGDNELMVVIKENGTWGNSNKVKNASKVNSSSQITAVSSGDANHIFYSDKDGKTVHKRVAY